MHDTSLTKTKTYKHTNKEICNALGCLENAAEKIDVEIEKLGTISLAVCKNCTGKFLK